MDALVAPHGGILVDRIVPEREAALLKARAEALPALTLDARELCDLELIATGAASPLTGFLGSTDYRSVLERMRLAGGTVWPLPLTLSVPDADVARLAPGGEVALRDARGRVWGVLDIEENFRRDPLEEARAIYGTVDAAHPGVAYLLSAPANLAAGPVRVLPLPQDLPFAERRLTPRALRAHIERRGWVRVAGFQTRNPIHRAHEHLTKLALEFADGLVIHPIAGETKGDDVPAAVRFRAYEALLDRYYPPERTILAAFPAAMRYAGPREALFHALVRKNYGIAHLVVGRDHAGVGRYYGPFDAQKIFDRFGADELGVQPLRFGETFFCRACENPASTRTCPHDRAHRLELSGTRVREILRARGHLPPEFTRPEVATILRSMVAPEVPPAHAVKRPIRGYSAAPALAVSPPQQGAGFIVWLTGLSGAGKTTLAGALRRELASERRLEVLDGDEVRTYLSKGLGFSREDRDENIRRIGYAARLLARNGVGVVCAAISPYAAARAEVRRLAAEEGVPFLEVYLEASLEALAARDPKGLYRRALVGEIAHFSGVSDPYEPPDAAELVVHTDRDAVDVSLEQVLSALRERGLVSERRFEAPPAAAASPLFPLFLKLAGRRAVVIGGGAVAEGKVAALVAAGARVTVVAPRIRPAIARAGAALVRREFMPADLDRAWLAIAAATAPVNRAVAAAAAERGVFVNAVDDAEAASAYLGGVFRRGGVTVAISTDGFAPALAGLLREGLEAVLPDDLDAWVETAVALRAGWKANGVPVEERRPRLLRALNERYEARALNPRYQSPTAAPAAARGNIE